MNHTSCGEYSHIEFHADDYGLFPEQSQRILQCCHEGVLNGISIMPNSPYLQECMDMLGELSGKLRIAVHLNLVEGKPCDRSKEVQQYLCGASGSFGAGFGRLLAVSYLPGLRGRYKEVLKKELSAQIRCCMPFLLQGTVENKSVPQTGNGEATVRGIRLDGHCHYHMIPVVFDALMEIIREERIPVSYIRMPKEMAGIYFRNRHSISGFTGINFVKVVILNCLVRRNRRRYGQFLRGAEEQLFAGVMLSGNMNYGNVKAILGDIIEEQDKRSCGAEILFHPGSVLEPERIVELTDAGDIRFLTSPNRAAEAEAARRLLNADQEIPIGRNGAHGQKQS